MSEVTPLTSAEVSRLAELEGIIRNAGLEAGTALMEIRDSRLYRESHADFKLYVKEVFGISRPRAYQLIDFAKLNAVGVEVQNEGQSRELSNPSLRDEEGNPDTEKIGAVMDDAGEDATASEIATSRDKLFPSSSQSQKPPTPITASRKNYRVFMGRLTALQAAPSIKLAVKGQTSEEHSVHVILLQSVIDTLTSTLEYEWIEPEAVVELEAEPA